jgi:hypothetical protein
MTPDLEPVEVGIAIVDALDSGLSHHIIRPAFMNILPFASRSAAWFKRTVELVSGATILLGESEEHHADFQVLT